MARRSRAKAVAEDREGINAYARTYYRNRNPLPPCQKCGKAVHYGGARLCDGCHPDPGRRARAREYKRQQRLARKAGL